MAYCKEQNIEIEVRKLFLNFDKALLKTNVSQAYCPIVRNKKADHPVLAKLAKKYNKDSAQVLIRWSLQKGYILPLFSTPKILKLLM